MWTNKTCLREGTWVNKHRYFEFSFLMVLDTLNMFQLVRLSLIPSLSIIDYLLWDSPSIVHSGETVIMPPELFFSDHFSSCLNFTWTFHLDFLHMVEKLPSAAPDLPPSA